MARPAFVLEVDEKTPPLMTLAGSTLKLERFGVGTSVIYPADAMESTDPVGLITSALTAPIGAEPLASQLTQSTKLTIVIADANQPLPRPYFDPRRSLVERVLETAARAGVDDVELVVANGLKQRWSAPHVTRVLGDRVATSFLPDGLITSHDVTSDDLVTLGEVDGVPVSINRRVAESDVVVTIDLRSDHSASCPLASGLADLETINRLEGANASAAFREQVETLMHTKLNSFSLVAVLGQPLLSRDLRFLSKREWEWNLADQLAYVSTRQLVAALPRHGSRLVHGNPHADYAVIDVLGGDPLQVHQEAALVWQAANAVEVKKTADVLVTSVWGGSVEEGDPTGSPLSAAHHALVSSAGSHLGEPLAREGGVLVAFHPLRNRFSNRRQSAAADFFAKVLPLTTDPGEIAAQHESAAAQDEWYLDLYRKAFAHHPLRVYHQWYDIARAARHYSDVIWVGADRRSAALLGHRAATTYADALEIASNSVGDKPAITVLHGPGHALGDLR